MLTITEYEGAVHHSEGLSGNAQQPEARNSLHSPIRRSRGNHTHGASRKAYSKLRPNILALTRSGYKILQEPEKEFPWACSYTPNENLWVVNARSRRTECWFPRLKPPDGGGNGRFIWFGGTRRSFEFQRLSLGSRCMKNTARVHKEVCLSLWNSTCTVFNHLVVTRDRHG